MVQSEIQLHNNFGVTDWLWSSPIPKRCSHCAEFLQYFYTLLCRTVYKSRVTTYFFIFCFPGVSLSSNLLSTLISGLE